MKLKKLLLLAFATLTIIPALIISLLLYKSGLNLSKESYTRNLEESINVQADFLSQLIEDDMISDLRFIQKNYQSYKSKSKEEQREEWLSSFQYYLETAEDRISVCILLEQTNTPLYTIGEADEVAYILQQLPELKEQNSQTVIEFDMGNELQSIGIISPIIDESGSYMGSLISVYDRLYLFKIMSSYYEIADTTTYICSQGGSVINLRNITNSESDTAVAEGLRSLNLKEEGPVDIQTEHTVVSGYYKNIYNAPWYLVGLIDQTQIYAFANQFIWIYILIVFIIVIVSGVLSLMFSKRVVEPINRLINIMDGYPDSLKNLDTQEVCKRGYFETRYLQTKFLSLMKTITLVQHNFEGVYQLYESSDMGDMNIDIDVIKQTIHSNKESLANLIDGLVVPQGACIVERFTRCFCDKDQVYLMNMFENMRDEHLAVNQEGEVFTPHLGQKWFHILTVPMYDGDRLSRLFIQLRDISSYKKQEYESIEQAKREPLTGLLNRTGFTDYAKKVLNENKMDEQHGVLFIDINNFKLVNDNLGHRAGDELLCAVAKTLEDTIGTNDIAARFGGDEFAVFLPHTSAESVEKMRQLLNHKMVYPLKGESTSFVITASIGSSMWSKESPATLEELLNQADSIMYQVKKESKIKENK